MEHRIDYLLDKLSSGPVTEADWNELLEAIRNDHSGAVVAGIEQFRNRREHLPEFDPETPEWDEVFKRAVCADRPEQIYSGNLRRMGFVRLMAVAAILVIAALSILYFLLPESKQSAAPEKHVAVIQPGSEGAVLTLADGSHVVIDTAMDGLVAEQNGSELRMNNGTLSYRPQEKRRGLVEYNTMTTPRGKQFQFMLPDGTKVWLNSASSIRYPTVFTGNSRKVEITGEAYFDVIQRANMPFTVLAGKKAEILVLGTEFNINAYDNETVLNTTLINGAIKVNGALLRPGQQAQLSNAAPAGAVQILNAVDISKILAWRNNRFNFKGVNIEEMMRQIERWYDIDVIYQGKKPHVVFDGQMTKDVSLDGLIVLLKKAGIHLRLEGRKLIVLP